MSDSQHGQPASLPKDCLKIQTEKATYIVRRKAQPGKDRVIVGLDCIGNMEKKEDISEHENAPTCIANITASAPLDLNEILNKNEIDTPPLKRKLLMPKRDSVEPSEKRSKKEDEIDIIQLRDELITMFTNINSRMSQMEKRLNQLLLLMRK